MRAQAGASLAQVSLVGFMERQTHTLSGGQKQRVAIAGALAEHPRVREHLLGKPGLRPSTYCPVLCWGTGVAL